MGLFGLGLDSNRAQFKGRTYGLQGSHQRIATCLVRPGKRFADHKLVDSSDKANIEVTMTNALLTHCQACSVPEVSCVWLR